jgi:hypothetical protein
MMTLRRTAARGLKRSIPASLVLFLGVGCAKSGVEIQRMPNDLNLIKCKTGLPKCLDTVDAVCKGSSYEILYARDEQRIFGVDQTYVEGRTSRAQVHCIGPHDPPRYEDQAVPAPAPSGESTAPPIAAPPNSAGPAASAAPAPNAAGTPTHACVPGATQSCVGPGACSGGQSCLPDGSGFGACDCGGAAPAPPSR